MSRGSIREPTPGLFRLRWNLPPDPDTGERRQGSCTVRAKPGDRRPAERELSRRLALAEEQAEACAPARLPLADFLAEWLETRRPSLAPTTVASYTVQIGHINARLGKVPLAKLTAQQVERHESAELARGLSESSVRLQHAVLSAALRRARRWKLVPSAVTDDVQAPRARSPEPRALDAPDLRRLISLAEDLRAPVILVCLTGIRRGELLALWWEDLDWERATLAIRRGVRKIPAGLEYGPPKSASGQRPLALAPWALEELRAHQRAQETARRACPEWEERGLMFPREDGRLWHPDTFSWRFKRLAERVGFPWLGLHSLRHSQISLSHALGIPQRVIQARAGHATAAQTMRYTHLMPGQQEDAAARLEQALKEGL